MAWAHRNRRSRPERFDGPMIEPSRSSITSGSPNDRTPHRVLRASKPLTLAGVPRASCRGSRPICARGARTGKSGRAVVIAADEAAMRALAETVPLFAPEVEVLAFPAGTACPTTAPRPPCV